MHRTAGILLLTIAIVVPLQAYRYGFVVGQNRGGETVTDLRYAEKDAQRFAGLLREYAGVDQANLRLLLRPDSAALTDALRNFTDAIVDGSDSEHALLFFFYSGHADSEGLLLDSTHLAFKELHRILSTTDVGIRLVILDACQSGAIMAFKGGKRAEPFFLTNQAKTQGEVWIASSSANERAQESETFKGSLFSFHLFNGLRGSADISNDNKVTVAEAYQYAYRKTLETSMLTSGIVQHPMYRFNITGEGDIVLTDLSERRGGILVDGSCAGSFLVMSRDYSTVFADFHKAPDREMFIALPAGDFVIINARDGTTIGLFRFSLSGRKTVRCSSDRFEASLVQKARMKGPDGQTNPTGTTETLTNIPQSRFLINGSGGINVVALHDRDLRQTGFSIGAGIGFLFREYWCMALSAAGTPVAKTLMTDLGLERRFISHFGYSFVGGGVSLGWDYSPAASGKTWGPGMYLAGGVSLKMTDRLHIGLVLPVRYHAMPDVGPSIGLALRLDWQGGTSRAGR